MIRSFVRIVTRALYCTVLYCKSFSCTMLLLEKMMVDLDKENRERGQEGEEGKRGRAKEDEGYGRRGQRVYSA